MNRMEYLDIDELVAENKELEEKIALLKMENEQYQKYCNPEYFKGLWVKGYTARLFLDGIDTNICSCPDYDIMNKLWEQDRHQMWIDEMNELGLSVEDEFLNQLRD